jgi:hypothetical protein
LRTHLDHYLPPVGLDGDFTYAKTGADGFVAQAFDNAAHDFPLAHCQCAPANLKCGEQLFGLPKLSVLLNAELDRIEQLLLTEGLGKELYGAGFHRADRHSDVIISTDKDYRHQSVRTLKLVVEIEATLARQPDIKNEASRAFRVHAVQTFLGRSECLDLQADRAKQVLQGFAYGQIVIDDDDIRFVVLRWRL